jgi:hypothetical protein
LWETCQFLYNLPHRWTSPVRSILLNSF